MVGGDGGAIHAWKRAMCPKQRARKWAGKGRFSGGLGGKRGVRRAYFGLWKPEKRRFFSCGRGDWQAQRGFRARIGHYVSASARPKSTPGDDATGEKAESPYL